MKFELTQTNYWCDDEQKEKMEKLGLRFKLDKLQTLGKWHLDGNGSIEINTIEELMNFIKEHGEIVINEDIIEIYNDYRE